MMWIKSRQSQQRRIKGSMDFVTLGSASAYTSLGVTKEAATSMRRQVCRRNWRSVSLRSPGAKQMGPRPHERGSARVADKTKIRNFRDVACRRHNRCPCRPTGNSAFPVGSSKANYTLSTAAERPANLSTVELIEQATYGRSMFNCSPAPRRPHYTPPKDA